MMIRLLTRAIEARDTASGRRYSDIIEAAKIQIENTYMAENISLNTVAASVGMSPSYFRSVFSREVGKTFVEYLTETRMEKAKELLMCSPLKTSEIGYEVGIRIPIISATYLRRPRVLAEGLPRPQKGIGI